MQTIKSKTVMADRKTFEPPRDRENNAPVDNKVRNASRRENALPDVPKSDTPSTRTFTKSTMDKAISRWSKMRSESERPKDWELEKMESIAKRFEKRLAIRTAIAKFFKYSDLADSVKAELSALRNNKHIISTEIGQHMDVLDFELERRIKRDFGKDLWNRIASNAFPKKEKD